MGGCMSGGILNRGSKIHSDKTKYRRRAFSKPVDEDWTVSYRYLPSRFQVPYGLDPYDLIGDLKAEGSWDE